jgi:dTDP-4-dehydrorhamnose 3,5-epimerase
VRFEPTRLPGVLIIEPDVHKDARGFFAEIYHAGKYRAGGIDGPFVQDNHSSSVKGTLRGLHLQLRHPQGKLIRVIDGEIFDVAVDVRRNSPTFGAWVSVSLSAGNFRQVYIPPGFAHGFCVVSDVAQVEYKCTDLYDPESEIGIAWNDPAIGITWPVTDPILSERDRRHAPLAAQPNLPVWNPGSDLGQTLVRPRSDPTDL